jgi:hypothetical protein
MTMFSKILKRNGRKKFFANVQEYNHDTLSALPNTEPEQHMPLLIDIFVFKIVPDWTKRNIPNNTHLL